MTQTIEGGLRPGKVTQAHVARLASRLTERDRQIVLDCFEHQVLTTEQLRRLYFAGIRSARRRLQALYALRVLDRFRPPWQRGQGSTPHHWVLDEAGAHIIAAEQGIERSQLRWRHTSTLTIAASPTLTHRVEVNEFFTRLAAEAAAAHGALSEWYGERTTHQMLAGIAKPDGYGVLTLPDRPPIHLLLELDRDTEPAGRLREKANRYTRAVPRSALRHANPIILLAVPTSARALTASAAVAHTAAPITVITWSAASGLPTLPAVVAASTEHDSVRVRHRAGTE